MNNIPDLIIGLWFLPVAVNIILPLIILFVWMVIQVPLKQKSRVVARSATKKALAEKRSVRRIHADEIRVDVSDGVDLFTGLTCNISRLGICIMGLPDGLVPRSGRLAVKVDHRGETYGLHVQPRWEEIVASGKRIGASIEYAPVGWYDFVRNRSGFMAT